VHWRLGCDGGDVIGGNSDLRFDFFVEVGGRSGAVSFFVEGEEEFDAFAVRVEG
jgi:hypothetical protein